MEKDGAEYLARVRLAMEQGGNRRPPLYRWMMSHHTDLAEMFADARLNWERLTAEFTDLGFRNGNGSALAPGTVRKTWYRVRKRKEALVAKRAGTVVAVRVESPGPGYLPERRESPPQAQAQVQSAATRASGPGMSSLEALEAMKAEMNRRSGRG